MPLFSRVPQLITVKFVLSEAWPTQMDILLTTTNNFCVLILCNTWLFLYRRIVKPLLLIRL